WIDIEIAVALRELGRLGEADALLRDVLALQPQTVDALVGRARIARRRGDRANSLRWFEAAASVQPKNPGLKIDIAADLPELGRFGDAEAILRSVLAKAPEHPDALIGLGQIARRRGDRATSLKWFETAATADPKNFGLKTLIAADLRELGRLDEAEALLRSAL